MVEWIACEAGERVTEDFRDDGFPERPEPRHLRLELAAPGYVRGVTVCFEVDLAEVIADGQAAAHDSVRHTCRCVEGEDLLVDGYSHRGNHAHAADAVRCGH